jgi:TolB-like protein/tetratricopeptide (TPR) repeat protein
MATVYLAQDLRHHRPVALKVVRPDLAAVLGPERFLREIEITAQLNHPHILPLLDSGEADGFLFYAMPYAEGESLRERLTREKQLPVEDALQIAREVADALSYAHSRGVIHRDIKPENILLESGHAVVADFGIARAISVAGGERLTATGVAVGTPAYMSPEQASGEEELDGRSDIYALACVLYEMLAGQPPFNGPTAESVLHQHLTATAQPVTTVRAAVPGTVTTALARALAKAPADRFSTATLFADALRAQGPPARGARSRRVLVALAGVAVAVAIGSVLIVSRRVVSTHAGSASRRTAIAVLPFENLSTDGPYAYFAGGLQDEILTQLSKVAALKVISRTSVMRYSGPALPPLREIGNDLGVGTVVEGSVQAVGGRLRVNVQLIDATSDTHLWAEQYDRSLDDAFAVQTDVAQRIVTAVGAVLRPTERQDIAAPPTSNAAAYRFYLRGREYFARGLGDPTVLLAAQMFDSAVALDAHFALAYAALAKADARAYFQGYDPTPARAASARRAADRALALSPVLPEALEASAWCDYWVIGDWPAALNQFSAALARRTTSDVLLGLGLTRRRLGQWGGGLEALQHAWELDPLSSEKAAEVGISFMFARRYPEAVNAFSRATTLAPDQHRGYAYFAAALVARDHSLDAAIQVLRRGATVIGDAEFVNRQLDPNTDPEIRWLLPELFPGAFTQLSHAELGARLLTYYLALAEWHERHGRNQEQRAYGDSALSLAPDDPFALEYAGKRELALGAARRVLDQSPIERDQRLMPTVWHSIARLYAIMGERAAALEVLERWARVPHPESSAMLQFDPAWRDLRSDPRFQALLPR